MPPSESKTKIRPQQSCLKCRERKVKCDRSVPCHACIIRGLEAECTYLTTPEDRAHISQAEIIERLRREVAQLRGQLSQSPRGPSPGSRFGARYARAYSGYPQSVGGGAGAGGAGARYTAPTAPPTAGHAEQGEGSWPGSSPSSSATTLTSSVTVTSPDSTGSDGGMNQTQASAYTASMGPYGTRIAEVDGSAMGSDPAGFGSNLIDDATVSQCHAPAMGFAPGEIPGPISMHTMPSHSIQPLEGIAGLSHHSLHMYRDNSPNYAMDDGSNAAPYIPGQENYTTLNAQHYTSTKEDDRPHAYHHYYHQWQPGAAGNFPPTQQYLEPSYFPSAIAPQTNSDPSPHMPLYQPAPLAQGAPYNAPRYDSVAETPVHTTPGSWKGEDKQELLETLFETIGSCDEDRVAQVIQVVRMSATPEEAVSGICQVLGIADRR